MSFKKVRDLTAFILALVIALSSLSCAADTRPNSDASPATDAPSAFTVDDETAAAPEKPEPVTEAETEASPAFDFSPYEQGTIPRVYIETGRRVEIKKATEGTNYAVGASVEVTSVETYDYGGENICDGNNNTRWSSAYNDGESFTMDLGESFSVSYIGIIWEYAIGAEYDILLSEDGKVWKNAVSERKGDPSKLFLEYKFDAINARYIKFKGIRRATEYGYSIYEFIVADTKPADLDTSVSSPSSGGITGSYSKCTIVVVDKEGGEFAPIVDEAGIIRVRGNSTAGAPKKPYNIKFVDKESVLGMTKGRKWCLLANMYDKTLMRNKISYDFTETAGCSCPMQTRYCDVYVDGVLQGNYLITTPVSDGYVDIKPENGEYLLERTGAWELGSTSRRVSPIYGIRFAYEEPDEESITEAQRYEIKEYLTAVDEALYSDDEAAIRAAIDVDSFVAMYICEELFKDCDIYHGSTYHYIKNGKMYAGPIWDMDLSMGNVSRTNDEDKYRTYNNVSNYRGQSFGNGSDDSATGIWAQLDWYAPLMECEFFRALVVEKYRSLLKSISGIYEKGGIIDQYRETYGESFARNYEQCPWSMTAEYSPYERSKPDDTFEANVEYLRNWLYRRDMWLRKYFGIIN